MRFAVPIRIARGGCQRGTRNAQRLYEVRQNDCRCRKVRCGGTIYKGEFWQLPQHASREKILRWQLS